MSANAPLFALDRLTFAYPGRPPLLDEASFSFAEGARVGLIGPNGCGKSSLFLLIAGLLTPQGGRVLLRGRPLATEKDFRALRREVGLVLQNADDQLFHATVLEDVAFGPLNLGLSPEEARVRAEETLARLGLDHLTDRLTHRLSGGEKRLAALAAILSMRPRALLLDEPTNDLDPAHRRRLAEILRELARDASLGWIIVSHDFDFLQETCAEFLTIRDRRLAADSRARPHRHVHAHPLGGAPHVHEDAKAARE